MKVNVLSIKSLLLMILSIALANSCSPEDGEDGAVGPQGEQGEQGPQGEQGEPGTTNVIYSEWIVRAFLWGGAQAENEQALNIFSQNEFNPATDAVLVYGRRDNAEAFEIHSLPFLHSSQNEYYGFGYFSATGNSTSLRVIASTTDGGTNAFTYFDFFRYVVIPGGLASTDKSSSNMDYTKMSYEEIIHHFNIPK